MAGGGAIRLWTFLLDPGQLIPMFEKPVPTPSLFDAELPAYQIALARATIRLQQAVALSSPPRAGQTKDISDAIRAVQAECDAALVAWKSFAGTDE